MNGCTLRYVMNRPMTAPNAMPISEHEGEDEPRVPAVGEQGGRGDGRQGDHAADRQVDAAGDDDQALPDHAG